MKSIVNIFILLLTGLLFSCETKKTDTVTEPHHEEEEGIVRFTNGQFKSANIQLGRIEIKNISSTISCNGVLDVPPQNMVSVSALMGGFIKSTELLQGLRVRKGQVIATIQNPEFIKIQSNYLENKSKLTYLEQEYKRQEELSKDNVSASKIFQQVTSEYNSLQATVGALEEQLKMLNIHVANLNNGNIRSTVNIYSPINGHVTAVNVNIGKFVNPQDVICEIVDTDHLHAELTVFEKDIAKIQKGQKIRFVLVNESEKERTAKVYLINRQISAERTIRVHAHLDKEDPNLMPNMYLKALIEVGEGKGSTAVKEEAIVNVGDKYFIFIPIQNHEHPGAKNSNTNTSAMAEGDEKALSEYAFKAIEIKKEGTQNGYAEVVLPAGFDKEGSAVVINGAYELLAKMNNTEEEGH